MLIELSSQQREGLRDTLEAILAEGVERGLVADAAIADSLDQAKAFWRIREMFGEVQRQVGGSIKHDISVPVAHVPAFIREADAAVIKLIPGARPLPFGHLGDGNIHYNIAQPVDADKAAFLERWHDVNMVVFDVVLKYGGSISAEHGIGIMKRDLLADHQGPGRHGADARAQAHARPERDLESGQGALTLILRSAQRVSKDGGILGCGHPSRPLRPPQDEVWMRLAISDHRRRRAARHRAVAALRPDAAVERSGRRHRVRAARAERRRSWSDGTTANDRRDRDGRP